MKPSNRMYSQMFSIHQIQELERGLPITHKMTNGWSSARDMQEVQSSSPDTEDGKLILSN